MFDISITVFYQISIKSFESQRITFWHLKGTLEKVIYNVLKLVIIFIH